MRSRLLPEEITGKDSKKVTLRVHVSMASRFGNLEWCHWVWAVLVVVEHEDFFNQRSIATFYIGA